MDLSFLNERQLEAVTYNEGPMAILSSAGSGKTRTIVTKVEYLVKELGVRPSRIWACTFTKNAANEMRERLEPTLGEDANRLKLGTLHSMAYRIYKQGMVSRDPYHKMPRIMTNDFGILMHLYAFCKDQGLPNRDAKGYMQTIANLKLDLITVENFRKFRPYPDSSGDWVQMEMNEAIHIVYKEYERWMKFKNQMDFQDMLVGCYFMLANPKYTEFTGRLQDRCEYILVDEAQDTNTVSFKILDIMAAKHKKISIVGDLRQSIYSFQGARIENITGYINKYKPMIVDLNINYRSTKNIVNNANVLISHDKSVIGEPAITPNEEGEPIRYLTSHNEEEEADDVFTLVEQFIHEGYKFKDIAILYRLHSQARAIEDRFLMAEMPYVTFTETTFFKRREIKDVIAYLKIVRDPRGCTIADLKQIANRPTRYIANKTIDKLDDAAFDMGMEIWEAMGNIHSSDLPYKEKAQITKLYEDLARLLRLSRNTEKPKEIATFVLKDLGYEEWSIKEKQEKQPDVDLTLNFDAILGTLSHFSDTTAFLTFVEETLQKEKEKKDPNGDYIKMMTIHASKGKEFKKVILLGVCDKMYPFHRAVNEGNTNEERRLMYVAVTRPQSKLYLSAINGEFGRYKVTPSPYLYQMNIGYNGGSNVGQRIQSSNNYKEDFFKQLEKSIE